MYKFNIAVKWENGEVEGFTGISVCDFETAERRAYDEVNQKSRIINKKYETLLQRDVSKEELEILKGDWQ